MFINVLYCGLLLFSCMRLFVHFILVTIPDPELVPLQKVSNSKTCMMFHH